MKKKIILSLFVLVVLVIIILNFYIKSPEEVKGVEKNNEIIVDENLIIGGVDYSLRIPQPSNQLYEETLKNNAVYKEYVQSDSWKPILGPKNIETFSDNRVTLSYSAIEERANGNYIFGVKKGQINNRAGLSFVEVDRSTGKVAKYLDERLNTPDRSSSLLTPLSENTYMALYSNASLGGEKGGAVIVTLDDDNKEVLKSPFSTISYSGQTVSHDRIATGNRLGDKAQLLSLLTTVRNANWKMSTIYLDLKTNEISKGLDFDNRTISQVFGASYYEYSAIMGNSDPSKQLYELPNGEQLLQIYYSTNINPGGPDTKVIPTIQVFDESGKEIFFYRSEEQKNTTRRDFIEPQMGLGTENQYYFIEETNAKTYLKMYNNEQKEIKTIKEYPANSQLTIQNNLDGTYSYYGYTPLMTGEFQGFVQEGTASSNFVMGIMDNEFNIISCKTYETNGYSKFSQVFPLENEEYMIFGNTRATNFSKYPFNGISGENAWLSQDSGNLIFGIVGTQNDFSPAILGNSDIIVDLADPDINSPEVLDNWLITGEKNGTMKSNNAIKVYDTRDSSSDFLGEKWLYERINRNYLDVKLPIDWAALGFDGDNYGPQEINYFVSDSQKSLSSMTRWINRVDEYTEYDDKAALGARNFDININDVEQLMIDENKNNSNNVLNKSKVKAWKFKNSFDETYDLTKVSVDQDQLAGIKEAKDRYDLLGDEPDKSSVLKPYPLKFTYTYDDGKLLTRTVNVFITDNQTTVTPEKIMYAYNYSLGTPIENAEETALKAYQHSHVTVYDYKTAKMLADPTKNTGLLVNNQEFNAIKTELTHKVMPLTFIFTDSESTISNEIKVTLREELQNIVVKFKDQDGIELNVPIEIEGEFIGSKYDLTTNQSIQDRVDSIVDTWYEVQRPMKETEIEVGKTETEVIYIFKGLIGFKSVTGSMTFEKGYIYPFSQTLEYKSSEDFMIKILDNRGTTLPETSYQRGKFAINATLTRPFTNKEATNNKVLTDAELVYNDGVADHIIDNNGTSVYGSISNSNERNFIIKLDENGDVSSKGLSLKIPVGTGLELGKYKAEITWDLIQGP